MKPEACLALPLPPVDPRQSTVDRTSAGPATGESRELSTVNCRPGGWGVKVFSQGQGVHDDQAQIASVLGLAREKVEVELVSNGGAFGGKEDLSIQAQTALAARLLGRPVRTVLTREQSIRLHPKRHPLTLEYAVGCDAAGRLLLSPADETDTQPCDAQPEDLDIAIAVDRIEQVHLDEVEMEFLYKSGDDYFFMNHQTYDQVNLSADVMGDAVPVEVYLEHRQDEADSAFLYRALAAAERYEVDAAGARALNEILPHTLSSIRAQLGRWRIVHQAGEQRHPHVVLFVQEMPKAVSEGERAQGAHGVGEFVEPEMVVRASDFLEEQLRVNDLEVKGAVAVAEAGQGVAA